MFLHAFFQGLFKNIVFRYIALVTKKLWAILEFFFHRPDFFPPCTLPYKLKKNIFLTKNPLNYYALKVTKFHGDSVKNESASTKKLQGGGAKHPPPSLVRFKCHLHIPHFLVSP